MVRRLKKIDPKICLICNNLFYIKDWQKPFQFKKQKCCSRKCNAKLSSSYCKGKKAHNNNKKERICKNCNKIEYVSPSFSNRPFCGRKCMAEYYSKNIRQENHWNWQGGITEDFGRDTLYPGYKEWRNKIFKRDCYACVLCKCNKSNELQAHHIKSVKDYKELVLDISNGLTVCKKCHKEIHYGKI